MKTSSNPIITIKNGHMEQEEINEYIRYLNNKFPKEKLKQLTLTIVGDEVEMNYLFEPINFERIRRITGYLVGTLDRFNDAKASEENQRIKHHI